MASYPMEIRRCRHVKTNGTQCGSPALKAKELCYYHEQNQPREVELYLDGERYSEGSIVLPVFEVKGITQIPVNEKKGLTFARGLRSILRHDPDKIMVGEIRDQETAQIAINSALTGHLVFTTVHANNVLDVLGRFLNM